MAADSQFQFVQFEFGFRLGPDDGRYLRRTAEGGAPERVIVLSTMGARQRRLMRGKRPVAVTEDREGPSPVPTARATLIRAEPLAAPEEGERWLDALRRDAGDLDREVAGAARELNAVLRAHRAAAADPYVRDVSSESANVVRVGYGSGDLVSEGRFTAAYELPPPKPSVSRTAEAVAPLERLAAIMSGAQQAGVAEELVLRARLDVDAGHMREAALQARIALEALLAETRSADAGDLEDHRGPVGEAANAALTGSLDEPLEDAVREAVREMRRALRRASGRV